MEEIKRIFGKIEVLENNDYKLKIKFLKIEDGELWDLTSLKTYLAEFGLFTVSNSQIEVMMRNIKEKLDIELAVEFDKSDKDREIKAKIKEEEDLVKKKEDARDFVNWEVPLIPKELDEIKEIISSKINLSKFFINPISRKKIPREKIHFNSEEISYVEKGELIATLNLAVQKESRIIFMSSNFVLKENKILSLQSGILRRGKNWVDLIPFKHPNWQIRLSEDKASVLLEVHYIYTKEFIPDYKKVVIKAKSSYIEGLYINEKQYRDIIQNKIKEKNIKPLIVNLSVYKKGSFEILISEDKMLANLKVEKGSGEQNDLTLEKIFNAILENNFRIDNLEGLKEQITANYYSSKLKFSMPIISGSGETVDSQEEIEEAQKIDSEDKNDIFLYEDEDNLIAKKADILNSLFAKGIEIGQIATQNVNRIFRVKKGQVFFINSSFDTKREIYDIYGNLKNPKSNSSSKEINYHYNIAKQQDTYTSKVNGIAIVSEDENSFNITIIEHQDAKIEILISKDNMLATLKYTPYINGGFSYKNDKEIDEEIKAAGIADGIMKSKLQEIKIKILENAPIETPIVFAKGTEAIDGSIQKLDITQKSNDGGDNRFKKLNINYTKANDLIAELTPYRPPKNGYTIKGEELFAKAGVEIQFKKGENVLMETEKDGFIRFYSKLDGRISFSDSVLDVIEQFLIEGSVGPKTGNIDFSGDVVVTGNVLDNFKIKSDKNIFINGDVGSCIIISKNGNVEIGGGFKGHEKGIIRAKKNIKLSFVENAILLCTGNILIGKSSINTVIKCQNIVKLEEGGKIIGGKVYVSKKLETDSLGSIASLTEVHFGQNYLLLDKVEKYQKKIDYLRETISDLDKNIKAAETSLVKEKLVEEREKLALESKSTADDFLKLKREFSKSGIDDARVIVKKSLFIGTRIESRGNTFEVSETKKGGVFVYDSESGKVKETNTF